MNSFQHNAATDIEPFESRIDILFGELELAIKWERPSTLFAVFASDYVRAEAEAALTDRIRGLGHQVLRLQLGQQGASADAFLQILPGEPASVVLFVGGTGKEGPQLGPTELAGLNLLRDSLA